MPDWKFDRSKVESAENLARAEAEFESWVATEAEEREYEEDVAEGRIVVGPVGPDGTRAGNR